MLRYSIIIDIKGRLGTDFALWKSGIQSQRSWQRLFFRKKIFKFFKNTEYLKTDRWFINKNSKVTRFNVAREDKIICLIYKKPGHTNEKMV